MPRLCFIALRSFSCCGVTLGRFLVEEKRTVAPGEQVSFDARLGLCQRPAPGKEAPLIARMLMGRMVFGLAGRRGPGANAPRLR